MLVIILWVTSSIVTKWKFQQHKDFSSPFLVTYYSSGMLLVYLIIYLPYICINCTGCATKSDSGRRGTHTRSLEGSAKSFVLSPEFSAKGAVDIPDRDTIYRDSITQNEKHRSSIQASEEVKCCYCFVIEQSGTRLSLIQMVKLSGPLGFIIFGMNWLNTESMEYTSQASSTVLSTLSGPFYLVLSHLFLNEPVNCTNVIGLVMLLVGSILIWKQDSGSGNDESNSFLGNSLALSSAFLYASYGVLMKLLIKDDSKVSTFLFLGLVGLWSTVCLWPFLFLSDHINIRHMGLLNWNKIGFLTFIGATNILGDYFLARSILLISPLVVSVGLCLDVPLSLVADYLFFNKPMPFLYILGAVWLFFGFVMVNLTQKKSVDLECELTEEFMGDEENI